MKESELPHGYPGFVDAWLSETGRRGELKGSGGVTLRYLCIEHPHENAAVVFACGYHELFLKYGELFRELFDAGISVYCCDMRGQGFSEHLHVDTEVAHVEKWEHYVEDLSAFVDGVVRARPHRRLFVLAQSTGGAISTVWAARIHPPISGLILSSPLVRNRFPLPARLMVRMLDGAGKGRDRIPGWKPWAATPFEENKETHSPVRHAIKMAMLARYPEVRLGGPTNHFVVQMMKLTDAARAAAPGLDVPVLVLKAEEDAYVDPAALDAFCTALRNGRKVFLEGARHEILIEVDAVRDRAIAEIRSFIDAH
jgi:lysophospholipase